MTMMSQVVWSHKPTPVPSSGVFRVIDSPFALLSQTQKSAQTSSPASHSFDESLRRFSVSDTKEEEAWFISDEEADLFWEGCPED